MELLSISQVNQSMEKLSDWSLEDNGKSIVKIKEFKDFNEGVDFINKIREIAEQEQHHPDLRIYDYNKVEIKLSTHSVQGLTEKDFKLAEKIDSLNVNH